MTHLKTANITLWA